MEAEREGAAERFERHHAQIAAYVRRRGGPDAVENADAERLGSSWSFPTPLPGSADRPVTPVECDVQTFDRAADLLAAAAVESDRRTRGEDRAGER
jgi:hypothetical protein